MVTHSFASSRARKNLDQKPYKYDDEGGHTSPLVQTKFEKHKATSEEKTEREREKEKKNMKRKKEKERERWRSCKF